jgi:hypothetical protein
VNIFVLDSNPHLAAMYHTDRHIVKMPTETAQMISFVYHDSALWEGEIPDFVMGFSKTHYKHPCSIWIRESLSNFKYACEFGLALYNEYQYRYENPEKHQRAKQIFNFALKNLPNIPDKGLTKFAIAMDEEFVCADPIESYRTYYKYRKKHLHTWKKRTKPTWI